MLVMAARKDDEKAAARELDRLNLWGARRDISPVQALSEELERTAGRVAAIEQRLARLSEEQQDTPRARGLAAELTAERGQLQRVAEAAARAGVTERRTEIAGEQALQVAALIRGVLADLELTAAQSAAVPALMRWHYAQLTGAAAGPKPPRPSQLPDGSYFDLAAERQRHADAQSGLRPAPGPPKQGVAPAEADLGRLIELRNVLSQHNEQGRR